MAVDAKTFSGYIRSRKPVKKSVGVGIIKELKENKAIAERSQQINPGTDLLYPPTSSWRVTLDGQLLSPSGEKDCQKYETARRLKKSVDKIRNNYREDWKSKEMKVRQRAVALYFIDKNRETHKLLLGTHFYSPRVGKKYEMGEKPPQVSSGELWLLSAVKVSKRSGAVEAVANKKAMCQYVQLPDLRRGAEMDSSWVLNTSLGEESTAETVIDTFNIWTIILAVLMALLVITTVTGNALVMLAFVVDSSLRTQNNYFLLNLAISDFLVGAFCIPLYVPYVLTGRWIFGRSICKLWLVFDYLLCTSSVFNIVLISYDRFLSVTRAVTYRAQQSNSRHAVLKMVLVWVLAFLLYGPAILSWEHLTGSSIIPNGECFVEFYYNWYFLITASTLEFFTPFISVAFFNLSIYLNIQKRAKSRQDISQGARSPSFTEDLKAAPESKLNSLKCQVKQKLSREALDLHLYDTSHSQVTAKVGVKRTSLTSLEGHSASTGRRFKSLRRSYRNSASTASLEKRMKMVSLGIAQRFRLSRDKKVAKSLMVIVCIFGLCWAPYTLLMIIRAACHGQCVPDAWYEASFWLLWVNSAVNPILYPLCHYSFKRAFRKLLCPHKLKIQPHSSLSICCK
ncbi:histamine H3 receptor [Microcaecilia unicolor]|uniref:Histamine H3 receptor n=1 Tax=Microcaecilia unicolor TaxID=1415580 RepID=A0A6P7YXQ3_9AMPH|nr:histamine H3 receptor [Microcaecilia unicolor]